MAETSRGVGLVLSGGGTRLFAHIGFLWALDDAGLLAPVSLVSAVVGNSAGSLVGAMFALGYTPREMWETAYWGAWGYELPDDPRAWRGDLRPRNLGMAIDPDFEGLARALTEHVSYFKGVDSGRRFEALLRRVLEREGPDGRPNPGFHGSRPPQASLPLYLIGFNLTNRRETIFQFSAHIPGGRPPVLGHCPSALGREASYEMVCDADGVTPPKESFRPWEGVRVSTSLPLIFRPYYKPRFWSTHWDAQGQPYRIAQGAYLSDGGSRDNYSLSAAVKLAGCEAVMGCFLGDPGYPFQCIGQGTAVDVVMRNVDGMMDAIFEADQDDAEIISRPVRTVVPSIRSRPGVTFDVSHMGEVMEAGYIAAAYYLRRLCPDVANDRAFLQALVSGQVRLTWEQVFAAGGDVWGPAAAGRVGIATAGARCAGSSKRSDYYIVRPSVEFEALARRFFAEQFPGAAALAAPSGLEEEIERRNRECREVAPDELFESPFRDMELARTQRDIVAWAEVVSWAGLSGIVAALGSTLLAGLVLAGRGLGLAPADLWAAELGVVAASGVAGWLGRRLAVRYLWQRLQALIRRQIGF